jgi:hypothetical protein
MPKWSANQKGLVRRKVVSRAATCGATTGSRQLRVAEFCRQLKEADINVSRQAELAVEQKRKVEVELNRLIAAVADGGHSTFLIEAIDQRERELRNIDERLNAWGPGLAQVQPSDVTDFVKDRLAMLRDLLNSDVTQARAELLRHVGEIRLQPSQTETGSEYVAAGEWNLLGTYPEKDRARHLLGVRARLVAGVGFEPTIPRYSKNSAGATAEFVWPAQRTSASQTSDCPGW